MMLSRAALLLGRRICGSGSRQLVAASSSGASWEEELGSIPLTFPTVCLWGSNTGVGKTLFSAGLAAAGRRAGLSVIYLKPVQTGFPADSDARLVGAVANMPLVAGPHAAQLDSHVRASTAPGGSTQSGASLAKTLYAWGQPVSPHLTVETEGRPVSDRQLAADVAADLRAFAAAAGTSSSGLAQLAIVETAGGVASPGPSGILQCDTLRALRLPGVLVGDGRLGGISATLSAYDSLALRGHQVPLVVLMDDGRLDNAKAIQRYLRGKAVVLAFPVCQPPPAVAPASAPAMPGGQPTLTAAATAERAADIDANLAAWLSDSQPQFDALLAAAAEAHEQRLAKLQAAAGEASSMLWWPFTQHARVSGVTVIDGRVGESFSVFNPAPAPQTTTTAAGSTGDAGSAVQSGQPQQGSELPLAATSGSTRGPISAVSSSSSSSSGGASLDLLYDSCASWWTQGVNQQAQPELVRAVSSAAARYGHVMFPENAHEPAVELAKKLLHGVGAGWAARVFYTDNGSTAIEVALKMAFRKYMMDHNLLDSGGEVQSKGSSIAAAQQGGRTMELEVLGLREAYHGDTLGAMEAVAPSPFNGRLQTPWYSGRGLFLDPPTVALRQGVWRVQLPPDMQETARGQQQHHHQLQVDFSSQAEVFDLHQRIGAARTSTSSERYSTSLYEAYRNNISRQLDAYQAASPSLGDHHGSAARQLGACILEPVLQGAGGMRLIDPLYQRVLVDICRDRGIPVVFDEVFTGFWRLGAPSGGALLGVSPDIACYAKLLTGGIVPLAATLATESVFKAFEGDSKVQALLHGHSYTAHPIGCAAGVAALQLYCDPALNPNWCTPEALGRCQQKEGCCTGPCGQLRPLWDKATLSELSAHPKVQSVVPLGTVLAVQLRGTDGTGYGSNAAAAVVSQLRQQGVYGRPLGDVVYLMVTPMTERRQCDALLANLAAVLG